jgi:hypothetical protein
VAVGIGSLAAGNTKEIMMITEQSTVERRSSPNHNWPDMEALRASVTELEEQARTRIVQRPVVAVLAAVAAGYLVACLVARVGR